MAVGTASELNGYKVVFVPFTDGKPSGMAQDVVTGFLDDDDQAHGRPVGLAVDKTGALLIADDVGDTVWRVTAAAGVGIALTRPAYRGTKRSRGACIARYISEGGAPCSWFDIFFMPGARCLRCCFSWTGFRPLCRRL